MAAEPLARPRRKRKQVRVADDSPRSRAIDTIASAPDPRPESRTRAYSRAMLHPSVTAATTVHAVMGRQLGTVADFGVGGLIEELADQCAQVSQGNLQRPEALLMVQSTTLDAIFQDLVQLAYKHMNQLDIAERLLRLAFRAQGQSRATVETLGNVKNPPMVIARQANLTTGPQQVNNGVALPPAKEPFIGETNYWSRQMANGWNSTRRAAQAAAIQRWRPWQESTGPRTVEGKARSARNAYRERKRETMRAYITRLSGLLRQQKRDRRIDIDVN